MDDYREPSNHLTTEQLLDYIEGRLTSDEMRQAETHLASDCSSSQDELASLTRMLNLMTQNPRLRGDWHSACSPDSRAIASAMVKRV